MEKKKQKILEARERFDKTLASPNLANEESVKSLVENQLLRSPFSGTDGEFGHVVQKRTDEVSNFLEMLRSASRDDRDSLKQHGSPHNDWKLKQENDQIRVMYREGPQGTPFHTLLVEGYVDGPVDFCLCVSWESTLYKKWWPQYNIPSFKIIFSSSLQKVRIGEEVSLVRVKVPWPVSDREAVLHNFELEYFEEDLILVLLNTIPDTQNIDISTHGFTKDGIPEEKDTVRIDVVGGFALQKVSPERSYFRAIANMDIKLDFVPPTLINFISRQLIANGHKLYQKAVVSVAAGDEEYQQALKGSMYARIRESLYSSNNAKIVMENMKNEKSAAKTVDENIVKTSQVNNMVTVNTSPTREIEEEQEEKYIPLSENQDMNGSSADPDVEEVHFNKHGASVSPKVQHALGILDDAISIFRGIQTPSDSVKFPVASPELEASSSSGRCSSAKPEVDGSSSGTEGRSPEIEASKKSEDDASSSQEVVQQPKKESPTPSDTIGEKPIKCSSQQGSGDVSSPTAAQPSVLERMSKVFDEVSVKANSSSHHASSYGNGRNELLKQNKRRKKKHRFCCMSFL